MNTEQNRKTEEILNSLNGLNRATAPDFFYTRLKAKMLSRLEESSSPKLPAKENRLLHPAFAVAVLVVVLIVNSVVLLQKNKGGADPDTNDTEFIQSIAAEYSLTSTSSFYDLNQDK